MGSIREMNIKNSIYCFFDVMINVKNFDSNLLKIEKNLHKNIDIWYIGYIKMKNLGYVIIHSVNPLHFINDKVDGYIKENNGNKYLIFASIGKTKKYWQNTQNVQKSKLKQKSN